MTETVLTKLERLKKQKSQLESRILKIVNTQKVQERKKDSRRKILIGSYYLEKAEKENSTSELNKLMDSFLIRDSDRALFNLPIIKHDKKAA